MLQRLRNALAPIEYPNVVLLLPGSPELFDRSKTASTVDQFVSKGDPRFTVGTLDSPPGYQCLSFPYLQRVTPSLFLHVCGQCEGPFPSTVRAALRGKVLRVRRRPR